MAPEEPVPCEDFATCGVAQFQNRSFPKNVKQQDSYFVVEDMCVTFGVRLGTERVALYGVVDGHGECGEVCAAFVRRHLPTQLAQSRHFAEGRLEAALLEAFLQTELLQQSAGLPLWASGACATAACVTPTSIVVANCGDCRCVCEDQGIAQDLSSDHNVQNATPEELRRVLAAGGTITPDQRVTTPNAPGRLATTRSFGDHWAKAQGPPEGHIITALPELRAIARRPSQRFLLLASDGVFGFMSSQEVVSMCVSSASQLPVGAPLSSVGHAVVCSAVARRSDDNCTCLVVDLSRVDAAVGPTPMNFAPNPVQASAEPPKALMPDHGITNGSFQNGMVNGLPNGTKHGFPNGSFTSGNMPDDDVFPARPRRRLEEELKASGRHMEGGKDDSDKTSLPSSTPGPNEVCWCPWCWGMNQQGEAENRVLGCFEKWRLHMHEHHFDKLSVAYTADEIVPCYWCCRPCVTKKGQHKSSNRLPFWGSHERVCRENPSKPVLPGQARSDGSQTSSERGPRAYGRPSPSTYRDLRDSNDLRELRTFALPGDGPSRGFEHRLQPSKGSDGHSGGQRRSPQVHLSDTTLNDRTDAGSRRARPRAL
ncbi:unnamed protein product [Effrenium voratum]|nr:unnamed protein product [Effrenium voratum]